MSVKSVSSAGSIAGCSKNTVFYLLMLGDKGVGKTTLAKSFMDSASGSCRTLAPNVSIFHRYIYHGEFRMKVELWDPDSYDSVIGINLETFRLLDAIIMLFDSTNINTFQTLKFWSENIQFYVGPDVATFIVATKCDMVPGFDFKEVNEFSKLTGVPVLLTSAHEDFGVEEAFIYIMDVLKGENNTGLLIDQDDAIEAQEEEMHPSSRSRGRGICKNWIGSLLLRFLDCAVCGCLRPRTMTNDQVRICDSQQIVTETEIPESNRGVFSVRNETEVCRAEQKASDSKGHESATNPHVQRPPRSHTTSDASLQPDTDIAIDDNDSETVPPNFT